MDKALLLNRLESIDHVGTSPRLSLKIFEKLKDPSVDLSSVSILLMSEQTICAQILRAANSVYFNRGVRINRITDAVIHLGVNNIKKILFAIEMIGMFKGSQAIEGFDEVAFWKNTVGGAVMAQELAFLRKITDTETVFLAAMLRNIGVLIIRQFAPSEFILIMSRCAEFGLSFTDACKKELGMTHREAGRVVAIRWHLPEKITESLNNESFDPEVTGIRACLDGADAILALKSFGVWDPNDKPAIELDPDTVQTVCDKAMEEVVALCSDLSIR
jgi:HD-like signal output (HDOD) protein